MPRQEDTMENEEDGNRFRLSRTKVRIGRERVLHAAYHILNAYAA